VAVITDGIYRKVHQNLLGILAKRKKHIWHETELKAGWSEAMTRQKHNASMPFSAA